MIRVVLPLLLALGLALPAAAQSFDPTPRNSYDRPDLQQQRPRPNVAPRPAPGGMGGGQWQRPPNVGQRPPVIQERPPVAQRPPVQRFEERRWDGDRRRDWNRSPGFRDRDWDRRPVRPYPDYGYVPPRPRVRLGQVCVTSRGSCWTRPAPLQSRCRCDLPGFGLKRGAVLR